MLDILKSTEFTGPATCTELTSGVLNALWQLIDCDLFAVVFQRPISARLIPESAESLHKSTKADSPWEPLLANNCIHQATTSGIRASSPRYAVITWLLRACNGECTKGWEQLADVIGQTALFTTYSL